MSRFIVDVGQISAASASVRSTAANIQGEVRTMQAQLQALQQSWQGSASNAFQALSENWHTTQARVEESLQQIHMALDIACRQYEDVELANQKMFIM